jgi:Kyakuja-Dileera-Zisupton transposase
MVNNIVNIFDKCAGLGYDIGCSFSSTLQKSSLANLVSSKKLQMIVNAFHGYAHNRQCQLSFHPLYITGFGLEDAETCERIFSSFNGLAVITRHASQYHRHQAIDMYARQWDEDKYLELCKSRTVRALLLLYIGVIANFLLGNYK